MLLKKRNAIKKLSMVLGISAILTGSTVPLSTFAAGIEFDKYVDANVADVDIVGVDAIASGTTKGGCAWSIGSDHKLTIRGGSNAVLNYDNPWKNYAAEITAIDIDVVKAKDAMYLFSGYYNVKSIKCKIQNAEASIAGLFACGEYEGSKWKSALTSVDISGMNTANVTDMSYLFEGCTVLKNLDVSKLNTANVTNMYAMFRGCQSLQRLNLANFNTAKVKNFGRMFEDCYALTDPAIGTFNTANAESMEGMFLDCQSLTSLNLRNFNTSKVQRMSHMFSGCTKLKALDISSFNTPVLKEAGFMFFDTAFTSLDMGVLDFSKVTNALLIVGNCRNLIAFKTPKNIKIEMEFSTVSENNASGWYRDDTHELVKRFPKNVGKSVPIHLQEKNNKFVDVRTTGWEHQFVKYAYDKKLMSGVGNTTDKANLVIFNAAGNISRAQFVQTLFNKEGQKPVPTYKKTFTDVPKGKWFTNAVLWASNNKLVSGVASKKFGVNDNIRRQDLVTILYKYTQWKYKNNSKLKKYINVDSKYTLKSKFADYSKVESYATEAMKWATYNKIVSGKTIQGSKKTNLDPKGNTTRAECAAILKNYQTFISSVK